MQNWFHSAQFLLTAQVAKLLEVSNRTDIPIGLGLSTKYDHIPHQKAWIDNYDLDSYKGTIPKDGIKAMVDAIMQQDGIVTLICIGTNFLIYFINIRTTYKYCRCHQVGAKNCNKS